MDLSTETYEGYNKVYDGVYSVCQKDFHAGGLEFGFIINNRAFLFEVTNKAGTRHLLMSGIPGSSEIPKVQQLEKDLGLKVTMIVTSGDFHHMSTKLWYVIKVIYVSLLCACLLHLFFLIYSF